MKRLYLLSLAALIVLVGCSPASQDTPGNEGSATADPAKTLRIAVIPKGTTHDFWKSIHAGAEKAAREFGAEAIWVGPEKEDDRRMQIEVVQNFISSAADAIVLAPLDDTALVRPVEDAVRRNIPVVIIDSGLQSDAYSSFVATDNKEGGRLGARRLGDLLEGKGRVILLRYAEGSASTENREAGFLEELAETYPDLEVVSSNQYAGATKESAFQTAQNLLNKFPEVEGIFCPNESSTFGMMRALQTSGRAGKVIFVGFDTSEALIDGIKSGEIHGLVAQDPFDMGYQGVKTAVAVIKGETVEKRVATRLEMITLDNLNEPSIQELVNPNLDEWLN